MKAEGGKSWWEEEEEEDEECPLLHLTELAMHQRERPDRYSPQQAFHIYIYRHTAGVPSRGRQHSAKILRYNPQTSLLCSVVQFPSPMREP